MRTKHVLLLCVLLQALLTSVTCNSSIEPDDCCFEFYPRRVSKKLVSSYYMTDYRCTKTGAILVTRKSRHVCVDPTVPWVTNIMKSLDEKNF